MRAEVPGIGELLRDGAAEGVGVLRLGAADRLGMGVLRLGAADRLGAGVLRLGAAERLGAGVLRLGAAERLGAGVLRLGEDERLGAAERLGAGVLRLGDDERLGAGVLRLGAERPELAPPGELPRVLRWASITFTGVANNTTANTAPVSRRKFRGVTICDLRLG